MRQGGAGWVRGWNLDYDLFSTLPLTAAAIEDAVLGLPTLLMFFDGHTALASRAGLHRAGITGARSFTDTSEIIVDSAGVPTGELREDSAFDLVLKAAPALTTAQTADRVREIFGQLGASGVTGGCIMDGNRASLDLLDEVDSSGAGLPLRIVSALAHNPGYDEDRTQDYLSMRDRSGARWRGGLIKLFNDGVIDTGTGWLYEPDTQGEGLVSFWQDPTEFDRVVRRYSAAGFQIATHAIGDRAIGTTIDAYLAAGVHSGRAPHRIEHLECTADRDLARMAAAGITASVQPLHLQWRKADASDAWAARLGPERAAKAWRVRDMIDAGALVALGSDWPVAQLDSRIGMAWARLRRTPGRPDAPVFEPEQVLTATEALLGYTAWAAEAQGDRDLGRIAPGFAADFAVWDDNPLTVSADELLGRARARDPGERHNCLPGRRRRSGVASPAKVVPPGVAFVAPLLSTRSKVTHGWIWCAVAPSRCLCSRRCRAHAAHPAGHDLRNRGGQHHPRRLRLLRLLGGVRRQVAQR